MDAGASHFVTPLLIGSLMTFAIYRRFRRTFGRQRVTTKRMIARIVLFSVASSVMLGVYFSPVMLAAAAGGSAVGATLAFFGLRHTEIESTRDGRFYTPNGWIGLVVTALFLGRLATRAWTLFTSTQSSEAQSFPTPWSGAQKSPLTLGLFFVLVAYYVLYLGGVLRKAKEHGLATSAPLVPAAPLTAPSPTHEQM